MRSQISLWPEGEATVHPLGRFVTVRQGEFTIFVQADTLEAAASLRDALSEAIQMVEADL